MACDTAKGEQNDNRKYSWLCVIMRSDVINVRNDGSVNRHMACNRHSVFRCNSYWSNLLSYMDDLQLITPYTLPTAVPAPQNTHARGVATPDELGTLAADPAHSKSL